MAYKVNMKDGSVVEIADAVRQMRNGSGLYLYDEDDNQVASFGDGSFVSSYPSNTVVTPPPPAAPDE